MRRSGALRRVTPMPQGKPLSRTSPLPRSSVKASAQERQVPRAARKDTGPDHKTRGLVLARDNWQCVACGKPVGGACTWWSIQHRVARGQGGGNEPWNLILLCGSATSDGCHLRCEQRDREMQAHGYWLESWQNPRTEPVMVFGTDGGMSLFLTADGRYSATPPEAGAAS